MLFAAPVAVKTFDLGSAEADPSEGQWLSEGRSVRPLRALLIARRCRRACLVVGAVAVVGKVRRRTYYGLFFSFFLKQHPLKSGRLGTSPKLGIQAAALVPRDRR